MSDCITCMWHAWPIKLNWIQIFFTQSLPQNFPSNITKLKGLCSSYLTWVLLWSFSLWIEHLRPVRQGLLLYRFHKQVAKLILQCNKKKITMPRIFDSESLTESHTLQQDKKTKTDTQRFSTCGGLGKVGGGGGGVQMDKFKYLKLYLFSRYYSSGKLVSSRHW